MIIMTKKGEGQGRRVGSGRIRRREGDQRDIPRTNGKREKNNCKEKKTLTVESRNCTLTD